MSQNNYQLLLVWLSDILDRVFTNDHITFKCLVKSIIHHNKCKIKFISIVWSLKLWIRKPNSNDGKCGDLGWVCILWLLRPMVRGVKRLWRVLLCWHLGWQSPAPSQSLSSYMSYMADWTPALLDQWHQPSLVGLSPYELSCVLCVLYYLTCMYIATLIIINNNNVCMRL